MQLILKNSPNAGYETDDVIAVVDDAHQWSDAELDVNVFTIVTGVVVTADEKNKLIMSDDGLKNISAISKLPQFRSLMHRRDNLKMLHRRKYQHDGASVVLKSNAQEYK